VKYYILASLFLLITISAGALEITSEAFSSGSYIPSRYTCDGSNYSPALKFSDVPPGTKSLVLICDDPDAPFKIWVHWVVLNIPPDVKGFGENISPMKLEELGVNQGKNDYGKRAYSGPCPPAGSPHRYFFRLYALDAKLSLKEHARRADVLEAMKGHIIDQASLIGRYRRLHDSTPNY